MASSVIFSQNVQAPSISTTTGGLALRPASGVVCAETMGTTASNLTLAPDSELLVANAGFSFAGIPRTIVIERGGGDRLTVAAGGAAASSADAAGGVLLLHPGTTTGTPTGQPLVILQAPGIGATTADAAMLDRVWVAGRRSLNAPSGSGSPTTVFTLQLPEVGMTMGWQVYWMVTIVNSAIDCIGSRCGYTVGTCINIGTGIPVFTQVSDTTLTATAVRGLTLDVSFIYAVDGTNVLWKIIPLYFPTWATAAYLDYVAMFMGDGGVI